MSPLHTDSVAESLGPEVPALADFPTHRQLQLVWRWAQEGAVEYHRGEALRAASVERFLHAARAEPCRRIRRSVGLDTLLAELGDDGVYHLSFLGKLCCGECASHLEQAGTDNAELYRTTCDPTRVPPRQRCPEFPLWPPYRGAKTIGSVRATLIDTLGLRCHCCQSGFGSFVDHDHFTGIVRGLVCA